MTQLRVATYCRASTTEQKNSIENQLEDLTRYVRQREWDLYKSYVDRGISGAKSSRPGLDALMQDARRRRFDIVVVTKLDRFGRSLRHLVNALAEFDSLGIQFCSFADGIDFSGPYGRAMFGVVSAFSQLERELIVARVKDGLQKARMRGKRLGRPTANFNLDRAVLLAGVGMTYSEIGRTLNVSRMTIARAIRPTEQKPRANSDPASVDTSLTQCPAQKQ